MQAKQLIAIFRNTLCSLGAACALWAASPVYAQSDVSIGLSALPLASVVVGASMGGSEGAVALPMVLSHAGGELVVRSVAASAQGTAYVLERAADGVSAVVQVSGQAAGALSVGVGTVVTTSAIGAGVIISAAGQVLAFIPNAVGQALLHNERL